MVRQEHNDIIAAVSACGYGRTEHNELEGLLRKSTMIIEHNYDQDCSGYQDKNGEFSNIMALNI